MQHVPRGWLSVFTYTLLGVDILILLAYLGIQVISHHPENFDNWGITPLILILVLCHAVYTLILFPIIRRRSEWVAAIISQVLYLLVFTALIETSSYNNLVIRIGYIVLIFLTALTGPFVPMASVVATWVFLLYTYLSLLTVVNEKFSFTFEIIIDVFVTLAGISGWLFFKRFYIKRVDKETITLSKLLAQEQLKSNIMLESISDGVLVINTKGTVQVLNQSGAQMLGWNKNEALKLDYHSLLSPKAIQHVGNASEAAAIIQGVLEKEVAHQGVVLLQTKNGRQLYIDIVASPIFEGQHSEAKEASRQLVGVIAVLRDVNEQKRQEQQRSEFISTASHEMRTPVASIQGFIELALNPKVATIDTKARGYLEKAHGATKHLGKLFQDLLTVSQSDDGRLSNKPRLIEVKELLRELVEQNKMAAEKKGLKVMYEDTTGAENNPVTPLLYVNADSERLREVVLNLFDNAVKYTSSGMITIGASLKEQSVVIRVSDTGMGIAEEDMPHLFQKFYRTDSTATQAIGGTGLGLYICKQIVDMMGGKIWVESTPGAGSTFYVEIPRVDPNNIAALQQTAP